MGTTERYARHIALKEIGEEGQKKINHAQVLVIGAGGLGSPVLLYLAAAGVGTIGIMDDDCVSESNLQRQILYDTQCLGEPKAAAAARKLSALNPGCTLHPMPFRLTRENAQATIAQYDIVVDATDNLETRYLINDACVACGKPFVVYGTSLRLQLPGRCHLPRPLPLPRRHPRLQPTLGGHWSTTGSRRLHPGCRNPQNHPGKPRHPVRQAIAHRPPQRHFPYPANPHLGKVKHYILPNALTNMEEPYSIITYKAMKKRKKFKC